MLSQLETASRALREASDRPGTLQALLPALSGCPDCGTLRMIASPAPLGTCPGCGADLQVIPASYPH